MQIIFISIMLFLVIRFVRIFIWKLKINCTFISCIFVLARFGIIKKLVGDRVHVLNYLL